MNRIILHCFQKFDLIFTFLIILDTVKVVSRMNVQTCHSCQDCIKNCHCKGFSFTRQVAYDKIFI